MSVVISIFQFLLCWSAQPFTFGPVHFCIIHSSPITISEGFQYELANPLFNPFHFIYMKYFTWITDLSSVDLFVVLRLVKEALPFISVKFWPTQEYKLYMTEICLKIGCWFEQNLAQRFLRHGTEFFLGYFVLKAWQGILLGMSCGFSYYFIKSSARVMTNLRDMFWNLSSAVLYIYLCLATLIIWLASVIFVDNLQIYLPLHLNFKIKYEMHFIINWCFVCSLTCCIFVGIDDYDI